MRALLLSGTVLAGVVLGGCGSPASSEEAKAAETLAPKPPTAAQQAQMDKIKAQFSQSGAPKPGHS